MSTATTLQKMEASLKAVKPVKHSFDSIRAKVVALKQSDPTLIDLSRVCNDLLDFIDEQQREKDLATRLDGFAVDMKKLNQQIETNLKTIADTQNGLGEKIRQFNLLEAKYSKMIQRVNDVLDDLEKVLRTI